MPEERKLVTILFADVTGSTALGEALDPEDVRALMGRYYAHARRVVAAHGGTLEKFIGDAVMAVFGLPQAHGEDPERALAAALALREAIARDAVLGPGFQLRIGVNTGEVVATSDPSGGDFLITGDAVNVAARLQQTGNPSEIVASERTAQATETAFDFDDPRLIEVKGKSQPLRVFPLRGARTSRRVERPPLVGRKQDLLQLQVLQARALEERRPQLVTIVAPAGTGKSRLLEEFLARLDPGDGFQIATARCLPYGQTLTYWPLRGLLAGLLGIEPDAIERAQVEAVFARAGYAGNDVRRLADLVLTALGIESESVADRDSIFSAWRLLVETLARETPRVVVFEDLHWASDSLLDLVEHVVHLSAGAPLLLIALSRPELMDRRPTWGGGLTNFSTLALQPLTPGQTSELVDKLLEQIIAPVRAKIVERSGGNPFFAQELARGLAERGRLGDAQASLDALPDTVHAAVLARLDLLTPPERSALQVASVAGRAFRPALIAAVLDAHTQQEIENALRVLAGRDLVVVAEGGAYTFRHILIRDVAYGTLSRAERIRLHTRVAVWLEATETVRLDEYIELIAYHYREAVLLARHAAVPLDLPIETEHVVSVLRRAGELAARSGAFAEARDYLQSAIDIAPDGERRELNELLGDTAFWGETPFDAYRAALASWRAEEAPDALVGARLLRKLVISCTRGFVRQAPKHDELSAMLDEATNLAEQAGASEELLHIQVARVFLNREMSATEAEQSRQDVTQAIEAFEHAGKWDALSEALDALTVLYMGAQDYGQVHAIVQRRLAIPDLSLRERADALGVHVSAYLMAGDYGPPIALAREQLAALRPGDPLVNLRSTIPLACECAFMAGRWDDLTELLAALTAMWEHVQYDPSMAAVMSDGWLAAFMFALAREDRALADTAFSALSRNLPEIMPQAQDMLLALYHDDPDKLGGASTAIDAATDTALDAGLAYLTALFRSERGLPSSDALVRQMRSHPQSPDMFECVAAIAEALAAGDNSRLAEAIEDAERHGLVVHAARMRIVLAQRTRDAAPLDHARATLSRLEDRQFLRRLDEVAGALSATGN